MSYDNDQIEPALPADGTNKRSSESFLPRFFRTTPNKKFLNSTLDQLIQPGVVEKLNGYIGRETARAFTASDNYIGDVSDDRFNYQLEPAAVIKDNLDNVTFYKDYNDFINQLNNFNKSNDNHSVINQQEQYAWNPSIDWDKFSNFREYYWLPLGPQTIGVAGNTVDVESTYTVRTADNDDNNAYVFSPDGLTQNPTITLYRGMTYKFDIDTPNLPFTIKTKKTLEEGFDLDSSSILVLEGVDVQGLEKGISTLQLGTDTPEVLYYVSANDLNASGTIIVKDISEATFIDVEKEVLGKRFYKSGNSVELSNGMKIEFTGEVEPATYANGTYYVEGVGNQIKLIAETSLNVPTSFTADIDVEFDAQGFDRLPYSVAIGYPEDKDYIVINRASIDGNLWSRYNRWFHKSVIEAAATANGQIIEVDQLQRAKRPIIEFESDLKLNNFGTVAKQDVDLVDDFTTDAFSTIEGAEGYNIDGIDVAEGMRIMFTADTDVLVAGRIFKVQFINFASGAATNRQITLVPETDSVPLTNEVVLVLNGTTYKGKMLYYTGMQWELTQDKTQANQSPLFDIFDADGNSYADTTVYSSSTFEGTKLFSYRLGTGTADTELGFPLTYRSISNVGDIVFDFNLLSDYFTYTSANDEFSKKTDIGFLRKYNSLSSYSTLSSWKKVNALSEQLVIRQYVFDNTSVGFIIDMYDNSGLLTDLWTRVYLNNKLQFEGTDYTITNTVNNNAVVTFINSLTLNDVVLIKTRSAATKNTNGYYEIPASLERNPGNENITEFTLGEVNDHVATIVEQSDEFIGTYPGTSNLRDIGNVTELGRRFVQHSSPMNLAMYHMLDNDANVIKSLKFAMTRYSTFKRLFLQLAEELEYQGTVKSHVDTILKAINKDNTSSQPFYFSDMVPTGATRNLTTVVIDADELFYPLSTGFSLSAPSRVAVQVYLNEVQLTHGRDYTFNTEGYVLITADKQPDDVVDIYEYETTNGSYVPPTPSKLGLYPAYEPTKYLDDTYQTPIYIIQGHDGSKVAAFDDYRDDLLLELEKRIYNNIKVAYDTNFFNIHNLIGSETRNTQVTKSQIDRVMLADFLQWTKLIDQDYTLHNFFDRTNSFTFNYRGSTSSLSNNMPGFWRQIYQQAYDTDRPHTHPWEMIGFSVMPKWWETQYGPAPYTKENLLLWQDIEAGIVREPGVKYKILNNYKRPGLTNHLPVDSEGNLVSPIASGYINYFDNQLLDESFVFGDGAPIESAWRSSSQYPFSVITAFAINKPQMLFATGFDRINQVRNSTGNLVYKTTNTRIKLSDIVFPNTYEDTVQVYTSGVVNYVANYMAADVTTSYTAYKSNIRTIKNQLGYKLAGFTDKDKFRLILDSRTPLNKGNVFVPDENYKIFLNTSTPIKTVSYSGVIIERRSDGYVIKGYDTEFASFKHYATVITQSDPSINIGGISESYLIWDSGKLYVAGQNIEYQGSYYRVKSNFTSTTEFDTTNLTKLPALPLIGGRNAVVRRKFNKNIVLEANYGQLFVTVQDVVDFLLGYGEYLMDQGFVFDYYEGDAKVVLNWRHSVNEFLFWTTQNWGEGSVITLSPASTQLKFVSEYSMVDNIFDSFYGYSLLQSDGTKLVQEFSTLGRSPNEFIIRPRNTADGVFAVKLPLVQKEHVLLIDNKTVFGDIIYDTQPGYRQERIKVLGYVTQEWDGSLNVPGFIYDEAKVTNWTAWTDFAIGSIVKYKEFYYSASTKLTGTASFDANNWNRLAAKPEAGLYANFEYKTNQFADFYDLDSDNFDTEQQRMAQHLIGYQKRQYLENIINDDVSQYKFYQGMIQDKGTKNALTKLFDVLSSADKDSLEFYEEWAIRDGQYGASDGFEEYELLLDESKFRLTPQPIDLVTSTTGEETDLVYRILPYEVYQKTPNYNHKPFPEKYVTTSYVKNAGYVNPEDVRGIATSYTNIADFNFADIKRTDYIWVGNDNLDWNVYKHIDTDYIVEAVSEGTTSFSLTLTTNVNDIVVGDVIGLHSFSNYVDDSTASASEKFDLEGFFVVSAVDKNIITVDTTVDQLEILNCVGSITTFLKVRASTITSANTILQQDLIPNDYVWIDNVAGANQWAVLKNDNLFTEKLRLTKPSSSTDESFGTSMAIDDRNTTLLVGAPTHGNGTVYVYTRPTDSLNFVQTQVIEVVSGIADTYSSWAPSVEYTTQTIIFNGVFYECITPHNSSVELGFESAKFTKINVPADAQHFGAAVAISPDGAYIIVGSPNASNVKTKYIAGGFVAGNNYSKGVIVSNEEQLWKALVSIQGELAAIEFNSFSSVTQIVDVLDIENNSTASIPMLIAGNYAINPVTGEYFGAQDGIVTDHMLIRAPLEQFDGSGIGNQIKLAWNQTTYSNQDLAPLASRSPFNGSFAAINAAFIEQTHTIQKKIDIVLYVNASTNLPVLGDLLRTSTAFGTVDYLYISGNEVLIYLKDVNGTFNSSDSIFRNDGDFIGEYIKQGPDASVDTSAYLGGYWFIDTPSYTPTIFSENIDQARGLVFYDVITDVAHATTIFYNSLDYKTATISSQNTYNAYIEKLSYQGLPGAYGSNAPFLSNLYVVRAPKLLSDSVTIGSNIDLYVNQLAQYGTGIIRDITTIGLSTFITNKEQIIYDIWDGYINFNFIDRDAAFNFYEPKVGQTIKDIQTGATAVVTFYQRKGENATVFVKTVTGTWSAGFVFSDNAQIGFLAIPGDPSPTYQVNRNIGQVQYVSLGLASEGIGKLLVFEAQSTIPLTAGSSLLDVEYWLYTNDTVSGIPRLANTPSSTNNEWQQVYKITAETTGTAPVLDSQNEGLYTIFTRAAAGRYDVLSSYTVPEKAAGLKLGSSIRITKNNNLYRAFIHAEQSKTSAAPGRIYFIKKGIENNSTFDWDYAKNKKFKGTFSEGITYFTDDIVYLDDPQGSLYAAKTNIAPGTFNTNDWTLTTDLVDYVGFIPNSTGLSVINDIADGSTVLDQQMLGEFGTQFDIAQTGEVLIVNALYDDSKPNQIVVYRSNKGHFERSQEIQAPDKTSAFGQSISISVDGMLIAISAPLNDDYKADQGIVYIYKQVDGVFELSQTLNSLNNERAEMFGWKVDFDGEKLHITARNADSNSRTYFDAFDTVFDKGFTDFKTVNNDSGVIYVYEKVATELLFAQTIQIPDSDVGDFGQNMLAKGNHIYVGLPKKVSGNYTGSVLDFTNNKTKPMWATHRAAKPTVDINKIKKMFLYNTKENELLTYIDYIDPIQGKVAGVAEQELTFKTYYDPALYDTSIIDGTTVDVTNSWGSQHIGEVWWNLTNAKFYNPYQGDVIYSTQNWSKVFQGNTIDVYEWVESNVLPSVWDEQADTENGFAKGYSGTSLYGDNAYSTSRKYDDIAGTFKTTYYFWVANKKITPDVDFRRLNVADVADYIADPVAKGYTFAGLISPSSFVLYNVEGYIKGTDVALSTQFWTIENQDQNIHNQYQIISEGLETSQPNRDIIKKWYDSLIGYDQQSRVVPDPTLSPKQKYGSLNRPRQSWFVNRYEALKQFIERTNLILKETLIVDDKIFTTLFNADPAPTAVTNIWDAKIDTIDDLAFIGVANATQAVLSPVVTNGKITTVNIVNPGKGYRVAPTVTATGAGTGAEFQTVIDTLGRITNVTVVEPGENYNTNPTLTVRRFTVLVNSDSTIQGKWALYERISESRTWNRIQGQGYNVRLYWDYADWYATSYSALTEIDYLIDNSYELTALDDAIGDVVKISTVGTGGWLLLEKVDNQNTEDYTVNYNTIGRQDGTIQFKSTLYDTVLSSTGFDTISFDTKIYDSEPVIELRTILESIKNDLFIDELLVKFNSLFFASLRYAFSEQTYIDWAFKTSFIKAKHNAGYLREDITFNNDNLPSYEAYIKEVKPFATKIREYLSAYQGLENTSTVVTDFDLPPAYSSVDGKIIPQSVKVQDGVLVSTNADLETYPNKNWLDNSGYKVVKVEVVNPGRGYRSSPELTLSGTGGAVLKANIGTNGKVTSVTVVSSGTGYYSTPVITALNNIADGGEEATYSVQLGDSPVRGMHTTVKFDRTTGTYVYTVISQTETFTASGNKYEFNLVWPMDLSKSTVNVYVNNQEALNSEYTYSNLLDTTKGYDRYYGQILFTESPANAQTIRVEYKKSISLMQAQDRINNYYTPTVGMAGKDLNQLMTGLDYGGVEVKSFGFGSGQGWDSDAWYEDTWDSYDTTFEDEVFELDGSTISIDLAAPLASGVVYNVYLNGVRIDDINYGTGTPVTNPNAICQSITGDGTTTVVFLDNDGLDINGSGGVVVVDPEYNNGAIIDVVGNGSDFFKREVTTNGVRIMGAGTVGGQVAVPDAWLEKVARMFELFTDPTGAGINQAIQRQFIKDLSGDAGDSYHAGFPTLQRVARGAGSDYTPNFLTDQGIEDWNLSPLFDTHVANDMVWYLNSTGDGYGVGEIDAQEVIEHVFHTLHMHGLPAFDLKMYPEFSADWQSGDLFAAIEEAYDAGVFDPSGYVDATWKTDPELFPVIAKEYLYLLNFSMFEYTGLWDGDSLAPEWSDSMRTQSGILANNPLGYALFNTYIAPVISKPSLATINSIFGNGNTPAQDNPALAGVSGYVVSPEAASGGSDVGAGDIIIIRKTTSDGTYLPDPNSYDTALTGGNLNYSTATGLRAEDIVIDGDGFVTATTSSGPEELVPGQLLDTIDIKVYERPQNGSSQITSRNYTGDGVTKTFSLDTTPLQAASLFVKVGFNIISADAYSIDYVAKTVTFNTAPALNAKVHLAVLGVSGTDILDIDNFVGDGSTSKFLTNIRFEENLQYFITLDGVKLNNVIEESDATYAYPNSVVISLATPPAAGSVISYAFFSGETQNFSEISIDTFTADGSTVAFELNQTPFNNEPSAWFTIVKVNNKILNAGYNRRFITTAAKREYQLEEFQVPPGAVSNKQMKVFLNNVELAYNTDWTFTGSKVNGNGSLVRLKTRVAQQDGDILNVYVLNDGEYRYGYFDSGNEFISTLGTLYFDSAYNEGDVITVYQFSNHDSQGFDRQQYDVVDRISLTVGTNDWYQYNHLTAGLIELSKPALDAQYVWITLNGNLLIPSVHYYVTDNKRYVKLIVEIEANDVIELLHFADLTSGNKYGWSQFKDMLNRTHYKRLDDRDGIMLAANLNWYDQSITVTDGSTLPEPSPTSNVPGILFIAGERIEYFVRNGNVLSQLRRGTLGTGVKAIYLEGENVYNQGASSTMPYKDETLTAQFLADGTTATYALDFIPNSVNDFEVFVAGKRLQKNVISSYNFTTLIAQDSPEGDATLPAEFSIDGSTLTLLETPSENVKVTVVRRTGIIWSELGLRLSESDSDISRFLRAATVDLPR